MDNNNSSNNKINHDDNHDNKEETKIRRNKMRIIDRIIKLENVIVFSLLIIITILSIVYVVRQNNISNIKTFIPIPNNVLVNINNIYYGSNSCFVNNTITYNLNSSTAISNTLSMSVSLAEFNKIKADNNLSDNGIVINLLIPTSNSSAYGGIDYNIFCLNQNRSVPV